jgi:hypothetical protein
MGTINQLLEIKNLKETTGISLTIEVIKIHRNCMKTNIIIGFL